MGRGATYQYVVVRKDMTGGALLAHVAHAAGESVVGKLPEDTRVVILGATKEQLAQVRDALDGAAVSHKAILETDGVLAGVVTAIGLVTTDRDALKPILGALRPYRVVPLSAAQIAEQMFAAYNEQGPNPGKTFDGRPVPPWGEVGDQVRAKWTAAAEAAIAKVRAGP